ncbi:MAG: hypothetical protein RJQ09_19035 [Cyclobacteriaceae bacterium]
MRHAQILQLVLKQVFGITVIINFVVSMTHTEVRKIYQLGIQEESQSKMLKIDYAQGGKPECQSLFMPAQICPGEIHPLQNERHSKLLHNGVCSG